MFRIGKTGLFALVIGIGLMLLSTVIFQFDQETVPNTNTVIRITSDTPNVKKKVFFTNLKNTINKENYQFTLVRLNRLNNKSIKSYYNFNSSQSPKVTLFKHSNVKRISNYNLQFEDIKGEYFTNASKQELQNLESKLDKFNLKYYTYKVSFLDQLKNENIIVNYLPIIFSIFGILLIIMFMEK